MGFSKHRPDLPTMLSQAARGDDAAREQLLGLYRPYLRLAAGRRMPRVLRKRADASDIVQQTLLDAVRGLEGFRGRTEPEFTAWMSKLLDRNLLQSVRRHTSEMRDVRLEQACGDGSGSACLTWHSLPAGGSSPMSAVVRGERALQLAQALEQLPGDQRAAVEMRYLGQLPLAAIAGEMGRSLGSVAGLIRRGVEALAIHLPSGLEEFL